LIQKHRKIRHREKQRVTTRRRSERFWGRRKKSKKNSPVNPFTPSDRYPEVTIWHSRIYLTRTIRRTIFALEK